MDSKVWYNYCRENDSQKGDLWMIVNNNFYGLIDGKRISDFTKEMDYSLQTTSERVEYLNARLNHSFFDEIFIQSFDTKLSKDGIYWVDEMGMFLSGKQLEKWCSLNNIEVSDYLELNTPFDDIINDIDGARGIWTYSNNNTSKIKLVLNTTDSTYTESNVCKDLSKLADYILAKDSKKQRGEYIFFTDEELFKRRLKEQEAVNTIKGESRNDSEALLFLRRKGQNYKKEKKQKIYNSDIKDHPTLREYQNALDGYRVKMKEVASLEQEKKLGHLSVTKQEYNKRQRHKHIIKKNIALTREDMISIKDSLNGTIYFKNANTNSDTTPDWSMIDFFDKNHIKALLQINVKDITTEIGIITHDLEGILKSINLRDKEAIALSLWRKGYTLEIIGKELGVSNQAIDKMLNMICKKVIREYELQYAKFYYLNIVKSDYQKCSYCQEYLPKNNLYFHYDTTNKRYRSKCKKCTNKR